MGNTNLVGVIGVGEFNCASEICARPTPLLPWQPKFENFNTKLAITRRAILNTCEMTKV